MREEEDSFFFSKAYESKDMIYVPYVWHNLFVPLCLQERVYSCQGLLRFSVSLLFCVFFSCAWCV